MKLNKGDFAEISAVISYLFLVFFFCVAMPVGWIKNVVKLAECDFEAPYKAEVIHGIGLVPVVGAVTGWLDVGK